MVKLNFTPEEQINIVKEFLNGQNSSIKVAAKYGVHSSTIRRWAHRYEKYGVSSFLPSSRKFSYTAEFKKSCVELVLQGKMSMEQIALEYNISSNTILREWVLKYNSNRELKDYSPKKEVYMAIKITLDKKKEIVEYCLANNCNYKETAEKYGVSYDQVYSWVKKYNKNGENGLLDKRGHHKTDDEIDDSEKLKRENARLRRLLEEKDMEVELLKKVKEFERK